MWQNAGNDVARSLASLRWAINGPLAPNQKLELFIAEIAYGEVSGKPPHIARQIAVDYLTPK